MPKNGYCHQPRGRHETPGGPLQRHQAGGQNRSRDPRGSGQEIQRQVRRAREKWQKGFPRERDAHHQQEGLLGECDQPEEGAGVPGGIFWGERHVGAEEGINACFE